MNPVIFLPFVLVMAVVGLVAYYSRGTGASRSASRLDVLVGKRRADSAPDLLRKSDLPGEANSLFEKIAVKIPSLERIFEQADCNIRPSQLILMGAVVGVLGMTGSWLARARLLCTGGGHHHVSDPLRLVMEQASSSSQEICRPAPGRSGAGRSGPSAGHSLAAGLHVVAEEMPAPISQEFSRVYEEQNLGIPLEDAMRGMVDRVPNLDLKFFVTSVAIQRQTGGDLAEILDKIGYVIRERYRILGQVKALTGEGRLSGVVLIALPFVLFLVMLHIKPDYVAVLWTDPEGIKMSVFALFMQVLGAAVIKKIVDIKV